MKKSAAMSTVLVMMMLTVFFMETYAHPYSAPYKKPSLSLDYYKKTCPSAEGIIRRAVKYAVRRNPGIGAGLIRMWFHDCFVRGCDASVLLDSTPGNKAEKENIANFPSLRGFEVIIAAKRKIEAKCPRTVSCADILAYAARDATYYTGGIKYQIPAGRLDGRVSKESEVLQNLPGPSFDASALIASFVAKGLNANDLVYLLGAHSIGVSHCTSFADRLYNFTGRGDQDPSLEKNYAIFLKKKCPPPRKGAADPTVIEDIVTPNKLDNQYYHNIYDHRVLFTSDQTLLTHPATSRIVKNSASNNEVWGKKFAESMIKLGFVGVRTSTNRGDGEIRLNCMKVNKYY